MIQELGFFVPAVAFIPKAQITERKGNRRVVRSESLLRGGKRDVEKFFGSSVVAFLWR